MNEEPLHISSEVNQSIVYSYLASIPYPVTLSMIAGNLRVNSQALKKNIKNYNLLTMKPPHSELGSEIWYTDSEDKKTKVEEIYEKIFIEAHNIIKIYAPLCTSKSALLRRLESFKNGELLALEALIGNYLEVISYRGYSLSTNTIFKKILDQSNYFN